MCTDMWGASSMLSAIYLKRKQTVQMHSAGARQVMQAESMYAVIICFVKAGICTLLVVVLGMSGMLNVLLAAVRGALSQFGRWQSTTIQSGTSTCSFNAGFDAASGGHCCSFHRLAACRARCWTARSTSLPSSHPKKPFWHSPPTHSGPQKTGPQILLLFSNPLSIPLSIQMNPKSPASPWWMGACTVMTQR